MGAEQTDQTENTFTELLAPLAQAMVAQGLTLRSVTEIMKQALLNAALTAEGASVSDSRISLMTGLHRKDVRRLRSGTPAQTGAKTINRMALLIAHWAHSAEFQDAAGAPRRLKRTGDEHGPGFDDLARRIRLDGAPGTMLQALCDQGAVAQDPDGAYSLQQDALVPAAQSQELAAAYRATLSSHLAVATHNLLADPDEARFFDRVVRYSHLSDSAIAELDALARAQAQAMLSALNTRAMQLQHADHQGAAPDDTPHQGRFVAGAFVWPAPDRKDSDDDTTDEGSS